MTLDGEAALFARQARHGGDLVRLDVAPLDSLGGHRAFQPRRTVTQWAVIKP